MKEAKRDWKQIGHDFLVTTGVMLGAILVAVPLSQVHNDNNPFAASLFILGAAVVSRFTAGYIFGVLFSVASVFCVNFFFTYPFCAFDMSITGYPLTFATMLIVSIIISTLTIRIKRQEQERFDAEAEKMRANLLRSISHDLRTPLTSILGASSALKESDGLSRREQVELLDEMQKDARWLIRITENLLSITRLSGEKVHLEKEDEVLEEIVGSVIVKFRKNHADISIKVSQPEEILLVPMDATLIEQVLINLFENVTAHAQTATGIWVRVANEKGRAVISVEDDGVGFDSQTLTHLFDGRVGQEKRIHDDRRNMGIGLSVCRSIIRAHGGDIDAENRKEGGGRVWFWLPCEEAENANGMFL